MECEHAARHGIPGRVIAANNEQNEVPQKVHRIHIFHGWVMRHEGDEIIGWWQFCPLRIEATKRF